MALSGPAAGTCSYQLDRHAVTCASTDLGDGQVRRLLITGVVDATTSAGARLRFVYEASSPTHDPHPGLRRFVGTSTVAAG